MATEPTHPSGAPAPRILVGLGNPGERYLRTRHNVGFRVVEAVAARRGLSFEKEECNALLAEGTDRASGEDLLLVLPQTFMNRSGYSLRCLAERRDLEEAQWLVVYDEVHLPLGRLRLRKKGSPGGHRGMESVVENLRTAEIPRLRCGVGPEDCDLPGEELVDFVLAPFTAEEEDAVNAMIKRAADACEAWLDDGLDAAMNRFNG